MTHLIHVIPGKESFCWTLKKKKTRSLSYSVVLKGFWRKRQSMGSKSTLLTGTFHSLWTGYLFGEKNSLFTGYTFQHSYVIANYTGQNNLTGAINGSLYFQSNKMKYTFSAFRPPSDHTQHSRSSYLSFPDPRSHITFPYHSRMTSCGYLKLTELARSLRCRWRISHKSPCFVDASLALMVSIFH